MLRLARVSDLEAVFSIYMEETAVPFLGFDPMPIESFAPLFQEMIETRNFHVYEVQGAVAGFCSARVHPGRARHGAYFGTFAVARNHRGTGLAREIVEAMLRELKGRGILRVELLVEADNLRAIAFYEQLGFEHEGRMRCAYKRSHEEGYVDELLMAKLLPPLRGVREA